MPEYNRLVTRRNPETGAIETVTIPMTAPEIAAREAEGTASAIDRATIRSVDVDAERDRRLAKFTYDGHTFQSDPTSKIRISGAALAAVAYIADGGSPTDADWDNPGSQIPFTWLSVTNVLVSLTPNQMIAMGRAMMANEKAVIYAGRTLKEMSPIPADFRDDSYWP